MRAGAASGYILKFRWNRSLLCTRSLYSRSSKWNRCLSSFHSPICAGLPTCSHLECADLMVPKQLGLWPSIPHHGYHGSVSPSGGAVAELSFVQLFRLVGWAVMAMMSWTRPQFSTKGGITGRDGYPTSSWFFLETIRDVLAKRISI